MDLKLARRETDGVSIIDLSGKITAGDSIAAFRDAVRDEVAKGNSRILINLKDVTYVDSSGLGDCAQGQHEFAQATAIDVSHVFQVDQDPGVPLGDFIANRVAESRNRVACSDLPGQIDDGNSIGFASGQF